MNQKVGNFPGVTVNKKSGILSINKEKYELIDLPGTYSLSSKTEDEKIVQDILLNPKHSSFPDLILLVLDATNLKRNLFLATQILDLGIPCHVVLNMEDELKEKGITIDFEKLNNKLGVEIHSVSAKLNQGFKPVLNAIEKEIYTIPSPFINIPSIASSLVEELKNKELNSNRNSYSIFKVINNHNLYDWYETDLNSLFQEYNYNAHAAELHEINDRYTKINEIISESVTVIDIKQRKREKVEKYVTHPIFGPLLFLLVFFTLFQTVFILSSYPMDLIEEGMDYISTTVGNLLPDGLINSFVVNGLLAGIGGTIIFLPQIMLLFGFITILEDTGYLSRISFISDKVLSYFGMNGKSIIPLVGGFACAVPAIMATRNIESKKERFITLFITPLMSCSARLPVYIFLVSYIVPDQYVLGFINLQGLFMMGLYLLGIIISLIIAIIINKFMSKDQHESSFILELPNFKIPSFKNVIYSMLNKGTIFIKEAGKIIVIVSIFLWFLSSFGPESERTRIEQKYSSELIISQHTTEEIEAQKNAELLEYSYIGYVGKSIEPVIEPLGFDWKIGIALITSFAAREVFVGTMETIYSIEGNSNENKIDFSLATAFSLLIFYVFAMQCMSTLAIVVQETGSWKIAIAQFVIFTLIAYLGSLISYQLLS